MKEQKRITIVGIGGVGGFFGGLLAHHYQSDPAVDICFFARGKNLEAIQANGIKVQVKGQEIIGIPDVVTSDWEEVKNSDYLLLAVKGYDLEDVIGQMKAVLNPKTIIIPLLNGVVAYDQLVKHFGSERVWKGCTYVVSRLKSPGHVENPSGRQRILFGSDQGVDANMTAFEQLLKAANIDAKATAEISKEVWEKYMLVSSSAIATAYYDSSFGGVMEYHSEEMKQLLSEIAKVGKKKGVKLTEDVVDVVVERLKAIPYDSTTSMHSDFKALHERNELYIMGGYIVEEGVAFQIETPQYKKMCDYLARHTGVNYIGVK